MKACGSASGSLQAEGTKPECRTLMFRCNWRARVLVSLMRWSPGKDGGDAARRQRAGCESVQFEKAMALGQQVEDAAGVGDKMLATHLLHVPGIFFQGTPTTENQHRQ